MVAAGDFARQVARLQRLVSHLRVLAREEGLDKKRRLTAQADTAALYHLARNVNPNYQTSDLLPPSDGVLSSAPTALNATVPNLEYDFLVLAEDSQIALPTGQGGVGQPRGQFGRQRLEERAEVQNLDHVGVLVPEAVGDSARGEFLQTSSKPASRRKTIEVDLIAQRGFSREVTEDFHDLVGVTHGFVSQAALIPEGRDALERIEEELRTALAP